MYLIARLWRKFGKTAYVKLVNLSWGAMLAIIALHFLISWGGLLLFEPGEIRSVSVFWYFYITTGTTVGYGDFSPETTGGRLVVAFWIMPGGIALLTSVIAKTIQSFVDNGRRWMRGLGNYENLRGHLVILGWQGVRTERMVRNILGDRISDDDGLVLCATQDMENPLADSAKFVRAESLSSPDLLQRAGVDHANCVIVLGDNDNETLTVALAAGARNPRAHLVAFFEQPSLREILKAHCPQAEIHVSLAIELMVRSARDPGSSRVQQQLLSTLEGQTQFSVRVPGGTGTIRYGTAFSILKSQHNATLIGLAKSKLGDDLVLNAETTHPIEPGDLLYFISEKRIRSADIEWSAMVEAV